MNQAHAAVHIGTGTRQLLTIVIKCTKYFKFKLSCFSNLAVPRSMVFLYNLATYYKTLLSKSV